MKTPEKQLTKEIPLPKIYKEFYPKNYVKKENQPSKQNTFEEYVPTKKKETPFYFPKYHFHQKNKFNDSNNNIPIKKKYKCDIEEEYSEDDYSGLASKNYNNINKKKNLVKFSEDHNDFKTKWKTEMCHYWEMHGTCKYGNSCAFAHGSEELNKRKMSSNYKTKLCKQFFELGYCAYGVRCQFSHRVKKDTEEEKNKISYMKILNEFNNNKNLISHEIVNRPRSMTFEDITKSKQEMNEKNRLALYEDILEIKKKENEDPDKVFSEDTNDGNSISNELNNLINDDLEENFEFYDESNYNNNNEKKREKRKRFISA